MVLCPGEEVSTTTATTIVTYNCVWTGSPHISFRVWQNTKQLGTQKYSHWSYVIKGEELPGSNVW